MAAFMSSTFTAPDRRKKIVTYGKSSRLASIPPPVPNHDAPSPERPRKHTLISNRPLKRNELPGAGGIVVGARATRDGADIFDVPSEDEFVAHSSRPTKRLPTKRPIAEEDHDVPISNGRASEQVRQPSKVSQALHNPEPAGSVAPAAKKLQKPSAPSMPISTRNDTIATGVRRGKSPQPIQQPKHVSENRQTTERPTVRGKAKAVARATASTLSMPLASKSNSFRSIRLASNTGSKGTAKPSQSADIFDVPSSDEAHMPIQKPPRRAPIASRNKTARVTIPARNISQQEATASDDSEAFRRRKHKGVESLSTASKLVDAHKQGLSLPQRSRKDQKEDSISTGHQTAQVPAITIESEPQPALPTLNKPRRTRVRTVPIPAQPPVAKRQSSPATLHSMLSQRKTPKPPPIAEVLEATALEDDTMYDIPNPLATPVRPFSNLASGSITPRQKALFGTLLGTSLPSTTPMPSISKLQLTDQKPISLLGALSRSKSDIIPSTQSRKVKLIANLKHTESSSDEDASGSESESGSEEEAVERNITRNNVRDGSSKALELSDSLNIASNDMDVDAEVVADSQASQAASGFGDRPRFTYAKSRSYLQEANPEDALLMSMDLDDPVNFGSQTKDCQMEEEEEASQVRPNHELRRQGQNQKFQWENEMLIDDISTKASSSIRRSTILELCTKMADETFAHELLDSSLAHQFLKNISSNGEIVFDFAVVVAIVFMLRANPTFAMLDDVSQSHLMDTLVKLLNNDTDIQKTAKMRKTNLSKMAQESVFAFRSLVLNSSFWAPSKPETVSPQIVALKALDMLVAGHRKAGSVEPVLNQDTVTKIVDIASNSSERCMSDNVTEYDKTILSSTFSILEAVSLAKSKQSSWQARTLQLLAGSIPATFQLGDAATITMAIKLCMNLTNNKPKACQQFSDSAFIQSLVLSIINRFKLLRTGLEEAPRTETLDTLILSLGAMINLTEHSDQARMNVDDKNHLIETLVKTFVEGSVRNAQAVSMEETQANVAVGYLSVLLGNMCLNDPIRTKIRARLPGQQLTTLVCKIKEFVQVHQHANRKAKQFEGEEGQETWRNYTARIMLVVKQLEKAEG